MKRGEKMSCKNDSDVDKIFEMMLKEALENFAEEDGQKIMEDYKLIEEKEDPIYSEAFYENINQLLNQSIKSPLKQKRKGKLKFITICTFLVLLISVCADANKLKFINTLLHFKEDHMNVMNNVSSITYPEIELPDDWDFLYLPEKIPVGYEFEEIHFSDNFVIVTYVLPNKSSFVFTQLKALDHVYSLDIENSKVEEIVFGSNVGYIIENNENIVLVWNNDICSFTISGPLTKEEFIETASSIKIISK